MLICYNKYMDNVQNQNSYPRVYVSKQFLKNGDYKKPSHKVFFDKILNNIQDDFENNGFRLDSVIETKYRGDDKSIVNHIKEIWQKDDECGDFRPLWSYAAHWKDFDPTIYNSNDVIIFEMAKHPVTEAALAIGKRNYTLSLFRSGDKPNLDEDQQKRVENNSDIVVVEGSAGTGKTVICTEKIRNIWLKHKHNDVLPKVLFLTYSAKLINDIKIDFNAEVEKLENIVEEIKKFGLTDKIKQKPILKDLNISLDNEIIKTIKKYIDFIGGFSGRGVKYWSLQEDYVASNKKIVDYDIFKNFYEGKYNNLISEDLKNKVADINIGLEYYFNEIEGVILGNMLHSKTNIMSIDEYKILRKDKLKLQFGLKDKKVERFIEALFAVFKKYQDFLTTGYIDRNEVATQLVSKDIKKYDYIIIDEVQDLTQREIAAYISAGNKLLFAGDTMQMINPTYFSFAALKDIYNKLNNSSTSIKDDGRLKKNYRNSSGIHNFANKWIEVCEASLGVLGSQRTNRQEMELANNQRSSSVYFISDSKLVDRILQLTQNKDRNIEVIDSVSAIRDMKGREAENVILLNLLSSNYDKWLEICDKTIVKNIEDENSVNRYYFNLFYVAITRSQNNLFIIEESKDGKNICDLKLFKDFNLFDNLQILTNDISDKELEEFFEKMDDEDIEVKVQELLDSVAYDKALQCAQKLSTNYENRNSILEKCKIYCDYVKEQQFDIACEMFLSKKLYSNASRIYERIGKIEIAKFLNDLENQEQDVLAIALKIYYSEQGDEIKNLAKLVLDENKNFILNKLNNNSKVLKEIRKNEKRR